MGEVCPGQAFFCWGCLHVQLLPEPPFSTLSTSSSPKAVSFQGPLSDSRPMVGQPQAGVLSLLTKWELLSTKGGTPVGTGPPVKTRASPYREGGRWEPQRGVSGVMGLD